MGKTELDRKAELRKQFYQTIRRSPGERISAFCTRYRTLTGEMRRDCTGSSDLPRDLSDDAGGAGRNQEGVGGGVGELVGGLVGGGIG